MGINGTPASARGTAKAVDDLLDLAEEYATSGLMRDADRILGDVVAMRPGHAEALHRRALIAAEEGRSADALAFAEAAIAGRTRVGEYYYTAGVLRRQAGRIEDAVAAWLQAVELRPEHEQARFNLALALRDLGQSDAAIEALASVIELNPEHAAARFARANLLQSVGRYDDAISDYGELLKGGNDPKILNNLGVALTNADRLEPAVAVLTEAIALAPEQIDARLNLGGALARLGRSEEALAAYDAGLAAQPGDPALLNGRATALRDLGRFEEAVEVFFAALAADAENDDAHNSLGTTLRLWQAADPTAPVGNVVARWSAAFPEHPVARHLAAALTGRDAGIANAVAYSRRVFDLGADEFERKLLGDLSYCGHEELGRMAAGIAGGRGKLDILDAGCGTGLCAPLLRPLAGRLEGIDVSPRMLARAARLGLYDHLEEAEMAEFLARQPRRYDLIAAADVFIYVGPLEPALGAGAAALRPGGTLLFTVEEAPDDGRPTVLLPHGRYAHSLPAVLRALAATGLRQRQLKRFDIRREGGKAVPTLLIAATPGTAD